MTQVKVFSTVTFILLLSLGASPAVASCSTGRFTRTWEDQVNANLDKLICLHNEQVQALNEHANLINATDNGMLGLGSQVFENKTIHSADTKRAHKLTMELIEQNAELSVRLSQLESRLTTLEAKAGD